MSRLGARRVWLGWARVGEVGVDALLVPERALLGERASVKRVRELCAGRAAARVAQRAAGLAAQPVLALADGPEAGRPYLPEAPGFRVSVSHAGGRAVAAVAEGARALGVDLEDAGEGRGAAFEEEAFADGELRGYAALPHGLVPVPSAWALKEAVLKVWGVGLRAPLGLVRVVPCAWHEAEGGWSARARVECLGALPPSLPPPPASLDVHLAAVAGGAQVLALAGAGVSG